MGCPATINVVHIVQFPEYKVRHLIRGVAIISKVGGDRMSSVIGLPGFFFS